MKITMKDVKDFLKENSSAEKRKDEIISWMEDVKVVKQKKKPTSYKKLEKTGMTYEWHPVYEIEFSNGLKILWAKVDWKLIQLKPRERLYKDVVNDSLAKWMWDSATKTRNKWRQSYWDKYWFPEVNR